MNLQPNNRGLSPEKLQLFIASLAGMAPDEMQKAKLLFLRNEVSELRAMKTAMAGFGVAQGCFAIIPIFWPILWAQRKGMTAGLKLQKEQIQNALSVWRDDLDSRDVMDLEAQIDTI